MISMIYFFRTNKDIFRSSASSKEKKRNDAVHCRKNPPGEQVRENIIRTEYYLNHHRTMAPCAVCRPLPRNQWSARCIKQHHANALFIEITSIVLIILFDLWWIIIGFAFSPPPAFFYSLPFWSCWLALIIIDGRVESKAFFILLFILNSWYVRICSATKTKCMVWITIIKYHIPKKRLMRYRHR